MDDTKLHLPFLFVMRFLMSDSKKPLVDSPFFESTTRRIIPISNWLVSGLITDYNQVINLIISPLGGLTTSRFTRHLRFLPGSSAVKHSLGLPTPAHPASEQYWPNFMWVACSRSMLFKHVSPPPKRTYNTKKCICLSWLWGRTGFKFSTSSPIKWCNYGTSPTSKAIWG